MEKATTNSPTDEIGIYLRHALNAGQFGIPAEEVRHLQELVTELEKRSEDWDGS